MLLWAMWYFSRRSVEILYVKVNLLNLSLFELLFIALLQVRIFDSWAPQGEHCCILIYCILCMCFSPSSVNKMYEWPCTVTFILWKRWELQQWIRKIKGSNLVCMKYKFCTTATQERFFIRPCPREGLLYSCFLC